MAIAAVLPRKMISFSPAVLQTLLGLVTVLVVSVVAIGQYLAGRQKGWQELAESRSEKIDDLQRDHAAAISKGETERDALRKQLTDAIAVHAKDQEMQVLRIEALEAQVAAVQRSNHLLQIALDKAEARQTLSEARNAKQHRRKKDD